MPLSPPVKSYHWKTTDQAIWAKAKLSMARYTPDRRTQNQPKTSAPRPATMGAASKAASMGAPRCLTASAAAVGAETQIGGVAEGNHASDT